MVVQRLAQRPSPQDWPPGLTMEPSPAHTWVVATEIGMKLYFPTTLNSHVFFCKRKCSFLTPHLLFSTLTLILSWSELAVLDG